MHYFLSLPSPSTAFHGWIRSADRRQPPECPHRSPSKAWLTPLGDPLVLVPANGISCSQRARRELSLTRETLIDMHQSPLHSQLRERSFGVTHQLTEAQRQLQRGSDHFGETAPTRAARPLLCSTVCPDGTCEDPASCGVCLPPRPHFRDTPSHHRRSTCSGLSENSSGPASGTRP